MADIGDYEVDGKPLSDLRVIDLKQELDRRGLSKIGSKKELTERLKTQIRLEDQQPKTPPNEGRVSKSATQDCAIDDQSDIVKEYLAQQQKILDPEKEANQRKDLEHKSEESLGKDKPENFKDRKPDEAATSVENSRKRGEVEPMGIAENSTQLAKENLKTPEEQEKTTDSAASKEDKKISLEASEDAVKDSNAEKSGDDTEERGPKQVSRRESRGSTEESCTDAKEARTARPRIRREFFLPEPEKESSRDAIDLNASGSTRRPRNGGKDDESKTIREKQGSSERGQDVKNKMTRNVSDTQDSASKHSPLRSTTRRSSDIKKRRGSSSSSSRSSSSGSSKHSRSRSGSSRGSSKHGSRSSSSSSSHSSKSRDGRRSRSKSESPRTTKKELENSKSSVLQKRRERSSSPQRPEKKRQRSGDGSVIQKKAEVQKSAAIMDDNTEDVITTLAEEEIDSKLDVDVSASSEVGQKHSGKLLGKDDTAVDEKTERRSARDADKKDSSKSASTVHVRKISLTSSKENQVPSKDSEEPGELVDKPVRKRKWGSSATNVSKKTSISISTDSLKTLIPDVKPLATLIADTNVDLQEDIASDHEHSPDPSSSNEVRIVRTVTQVINETNPEETADVENVTQEVTERPHTYLRPLSLMEEPVARTRSPSPARNTPTRIVHIRNLVRPFTLKQLKDLLARTGTLAEGGFWIDKIKSKCYATYETDQQAILTRHALHGTQWPPSNRKNLIVDYADEDELKFHMSLSDVVVPPKPDPYVEPPIKELMTRRVREMGAPISAAVNKTREHPVVPPPIREWDRDKIGEKSPGEKERRRRSISPLRDRRRERERDRLRTEPKERRERKVERRKEEEEAPAKLLDDLFRKTKTTPCIYWLPLTTEQIKKREEEKKQRQAERAKRLQQMQRRDPPAKDKPNATKDVKKPKTENDSRRRRRSTSAGRSRNRKR